MSEQWVLVPRKTTPHMRKEGAKALLTEGGAVWTTMLAAAPPIPQDVWDAMVERGARAAITPLLYDSMTPGLQANQRLLFARGLRAALSLPETETRET